MPRWVYPGISGCMKRLVDVLMTALSLVLVPAVLASTEGSFRGLIVEPPPNSSPDWVYVQGHNGLIRKVNVAAARLVYDDDVPFSERERGTHPTLAPGTEVRVTAEQDGSGEWRATMVEILRLPVRRTGGSKTLADTTPCGCDTSNDEKKLSGDLSLTAWQDCNCIDLCVEARGQRIERMDAL